jgi:hypothetical protein
MSSKIAALTSSGQLKRIIVDFKWFLGLLFYHLEQKQRSANRVFSQ